MKQLALCLALSVVLSAQVVPPRQTPLPPEQTSPPQNHLVEVPLLDCGGLPCVEMSTANGKTLRLAIDTAEVNSYLDVKAAQSLGASLQALKGGDGVSQVQQTIVPGAKIGDLPMGDFPFMVLDTTPQPNQPGEKVTPFPAAGALAYSAFQNRLLKIDFAHRVIRLSEPLDSSQTCPRECSDLVVKRIGSYGPPTLTTTGFSLNGQPVEAQLDTFFSGTMLIYPESVEKFGLKKVAKGKHKEFFPFTQGGVRLAQAEGTTQAFQSIQFGQDLPLYFCTPEDHPNKVSFDATIGTALLSRAVAVFDFKGMRFWLEAAGAELTPGSSAPSGPPGR